MGITTLSSVAVRCRKAVLCVLKRTQRILYVKFETWAILKELQVFDQAGVESSL